MWLDVDRDFVESIDQFGEYFHLTVLSSSPGTHKMSFHLFISSGSFNSVLLFSAYKSCTSFVKFIPNFMIFEYFDAIFF